MEAACGWQRIASRTRDETREFRRENRKAKRESDRLLRGEPAPDTGSRSKTKKTERERQLIGDGGNFALTVLVLISIYLQANLIRFGGKTH